MAGWAIAGMWSFIFGLVELAILVVFIIVWIQVYQDKATHRSFLDKWANIVVIDYEKGANPLGQ
jgi:hypothetical protein